MKMITKILYYINVNHFTNKIFLYRLNFWILDVIKFLPYVLLIVIFLHPPYKTAVQIKLLLY